MNHVNNSPAIPPADRRRHSRLPPTRRASSRLLRLPEVMGRVGLSRSTIYELMATGRFPRQIYLGARSVAWAQEDLDAWISQQQQRSQSQHS